MSRFSVGLVLRRLGRILLNAVLLVYSCFNIYPVLWMLASSLKTTAEYRGNVLGLPTGLEVGNYVNAFLNSKLYRYMWNTTVNVIVVVPIALAFAFVVGYLLSRYKFRFRGAVYALFMVGIFVPSHVLLVPLYLEFSLLNILDRIYTLWVPLIAFAIPISIFLIEGYVKTVPRDIEEAAVIDGAGFWTILLRMMMPICRPVLTTSLILIFVNVWNEFALSYTLLQKDTYRTISYAIKMMDAENSMNIPLKLAALLIASCPVILLYVTFSDKIIIGMTSGAVKG